MATNKNRAVILLTNEISKSYNQYARKTAENLGVKSSYRALLFELAEEEGVTQLDLVKKTGLKAPTVSITLRKMEKEGIVTRKVDENDLRKTHVYLTDIGRDLDLTNKRKMAESEEKIFKGIDLGDKEILLDALQKMRNNLIVLNDDEF